MMWTTGQNDVIRELGHQGVQVVHDAILERFGVDHTLHAIESQACRIHASLKVLTECPECHALGVRINRQSGMCRRCTEAAHVLQLGTDEEKWLCAQDGRTISPGRRACPLWELNERRTEQPRRD